MFHVKQMARRYTPDRPLKTATGKVLLNDGAEYGPAMRKLPPRQRQFVLAYMAMGGQAREHVTRAYFEAGYRATTPETARVNARRILRSTEVQAALIEEGRRALAASGAIAVDVVEEIMTDITAPRKDRLSAAKLVMDRGGLHGMSEHKTTVAHELSEDQMLLQITQISKRLGVDPAKLLGDELAKKYIGHEPAAPTIDADFVEYDPELDDLLS